MKILYIKVYSAFIALLKCDDLEQVYKGNSPFMDLDVSLQAEAELQTQSKSEAHCKHEERADLKHMLQRIDALLFMFSLSLAVNQIKSGSFLLLPVGKMQQNTTSPPQEKKINTKLRAPLAFQIP